MATVIIDRGNTEKMQNTPNIDGLIYFNSDDNCIYLDNGSTRTIYGGKIPTITSVSNNDGASNSNIYTALAAKNGFCIKANVADSSDNINNTTENGRPVGCMGFNIHTNNGSRMTMATDLGCVTDGILKQFMGADLAVIESNYDDMMLRENENYPYYLKTRIASNRGHLSNVQCSDAAVKLLENGIKKLHLCHLSNNNNTPSTALSQLAVTAMSKGIDLQKDIEIIKANRRHEITVPTQF